MLYNNHALYKDLQNLSQVDKQGGQEQARKLRMGELVGQDRQNRREGKEQG